MIISRINPEIDAGRKADWGQTSEDYAQHRPGPPQSFYERLADLGIGLKGQSILDLGTGTGVLAREFAARGCHVSASDISEGQIEMACYLAEKDGLDIYFRAAPANAPLFDENSFDVVTACQCWWYFNRDEALSEIGRILKPGGCLVICQFSFLPREDPIVAASENLVLKYNPDWSGADWDGSVPFMPESMPQRLKTSMFVYDEAIPFTREAWRGRMRALRGIGASLSPAKISAFDAEHEVLLQTLAPESFTIRHRIDAHIYVFG